MDSSNNTPANIQREMQKFMLKYNLDNTNPYHMKATLNIFSLMNTQPTDEKKLLFRLKKFLGKEFVLKREFNLLKRREPTYHEKGVYPLVNVFIIYGVDRFNNKDWYRTLSSFHLSQYSNFENEDTKQKQEAIEKYVKQKVMFEKLDSSHLGLIFLNDQGKELVKNLFEDPKDTIINNLKLEQVQGDSDPQELFQNWRVLSRGWFSIKEFKGQKMEIRHATNKEFQNGQWIIKKNILQDQFLQRIYFYATELQKKQLKSKNQQSQRFTKIQRMKTQCYKRSFSFDSSKGVNKQRSRSRQKKLKLKNAQVHIGNSSYQKGQNKNIQTYRKKYGFDQLSQDLEKMSCSQKNKGNLDVSLVMNDQKYQRRKQQSKVKEEYNQQSFIQINQKVGNNQISAMVQQFQYFKNKFPNKSFLQNIQFQNINNSQIQDRSKRQNSLRSKTCEKLKNSTKNPRNFKHIGLCKKREAELYQPTFNQSWNYSKYVQMTEIIKRPTKRPCEQKGDIPIIDLVSEDEANLPYIKTQMPVLGKQSQLDMDIEEDKQNDIGKVNQNAIIDNVKEEEDIQKASKKFKF